MLFGGGAVACAYAASKFDYNSHLLEKHVFWMAFNALAGVGMGHFAMQFTTMREKYMEFFAIMGYALFYVAGFIFKTEFDRQYYDMKVYENNLIANAIPLSIGSLFYA